MVCVPRSDRILSSVTVQIESGAVPRTAGTHFIVFSASYDIRAVQEIGWLRFGPVCHSTVQYLELSL